MAIKRIILGIVALILFGGIATALYRFLGGVPGEPEAQNRITQQMVYTLPITPLAADGFVMQGLG